MALALYRKYRPATFAEVVGQEHVTGPLRAALAAGRINHAYLFSGPRGCGKTSSARILARSLNCASGPTPDPCGTCSSCVALAPEGPGSLDVVELDAASHGGVDDTRELRDRAFYMPAESRYRVFIIDEAHMVTNQGFNALLKIVEEPPEHLVFIFATTEPEKVLPTIRSRTHHYPFHLLPPAVLRGLLEKLCGEEHVAVEPAVYPLVVKAGAGSARDSLSVMDQLLAGAGSAGVTYSNAVALLGVTDSALLDEMIDALSAADGAGVFGAIERVAQAGHDPRRFGADLLQRLRDLVILQAVPDAADKGLIDEPADQLAAMVAQAGRLPIATLTRFAEVLHTGLTDMRGTTSPRLVLELLAARMLLPAATLDDAGLLQRLERVERRLDIVAEHHVDEQAASAAPPAPASRPKASVVAAPLPATAPAAAVGHVAGVRPAPQPVREPDLGLPQPPVLSSAIPAPATQAAMPPSVSTVAMPEADAEAPGRTPPATNPDVDAVDVRRLWPQVLEIIKGQNRRAHALLDSAALTIVRVDGGVLYLTTQFPALARMIAEARNADIVRDALRGLLGVDWRIRFEDADTASDTRGGAVAARAEGGVARDAGSSTGQAAQSSAPRASASPASPEPHERPGAASHSGDRRGVERHGSGGGETPPADEEPERGASVAEYDPYSEIDPDEDAAGSPSYQVIDPSQAAMELLEKKLGARRIDPAG